MLLIPGWCWRAGKAKGRDGGLREPDIHGSGVKRHDPGVYSFHMVVTGEGREVQHVRGLRSLHLRSKNIFFPSLSQGAESSLFQQRDAELQVFETNTSPVHFSVLGMTLGSHSLFS